MSYTLEENVKNLIDGEKNDMRVVIDEEEERKSACIYRRALWNS